MRQPVGVVSERGLLRQDRQAGQQRGGRIQQQVIDVGDAPGGGELEGQQGQQVAGGGGRLGGGGAGRGGPRREAGGGPGGGRPQHAGHGGGGAGAQGGEVGHRRV